MGDTDVVEQWLNTVSTVRSEHEQHLQMFLDFTGKSAQQILDEYKAGSKKHFKDMYSQSLLDFTAHLRQQNFEPNEIRKKTESVRLFFEHHNLPLGFGARAHLRFLFR